MKIEPYSGRVDDEIISLILPIQNDEVKIGLSLQKQPDLPDVHRSYRETGGELLVALSDDRVIGTIGLMMQEKHCAILKKIFVKKKFCSQKEGRALYQELFRFARGAGVRQIMLDTLSVAHASHRFYERTGFCRMDPSELPIPYVYPGRNRRLYRPEVQ